MYYSLISELGHVYFALLACGLTSRSQIHRVAEQTKAWHARSYHARHNLTAIDADGEHDEIVAVVSVAHRLDNVERGQAQETRVRLD